MNARMQPPPDDPGQHPFIQAIRMEVDRMEAIQKNIYKSVKINITVAAIILIACAINLTFYVLLTIERAQ